MHHRDRIGREDGQAMVELALVLPVLCLLLFGVIQFGIAFNNYLTLTDAVREGARQGAIARFQPDPQTFTSNKVISSAVGLDTSQLDVTVTPSAAWTPGSDVTVTATYPYDISLLGIVIASGRMSSSNTERVE